VLITAAYRTLNSGSIRTTTSPTTVELSSATSPEWSTASLTCLPYHRTPRRRRRYTRHVKSLSRRFGATFIVTMTVTQGSGLLSASEEFPPIKLWVCQRSFSRSTISMPKVTTPYLSAGIEAIWSPATLHVLDFPVSHCSTDGSASFDGHNALSGHCAQAGLRAWQIFRPWRISR
jgi:hypothetical protein